MEERLSFKTIFSPLAYFMIMHFIIDAKTEASGPRCTYYSEARTAEPVYNLPNCTWYKELSCCRRTEVTSVMDSMERIHETTDACRARLHYMMCYFCSPEQIKWYDTKAYVCLSFCEETFEECKTSKLGNLTISEIFKDGRQLCQDNSFQVVSGLDRCFNFDASVFGRGAGVQYQYLLLSGILLSTLYLLT